MTLSIGFDTTGLSAGLSTASEEISRLAREEISPAAGLIEEAFDGAARSIERSLARAARSGSLSLKGLAESLVRDLSRIAIDGLVRRPIETALTAALTAPFGGGRAEGGLVAAGQQYLVGERGPELFTPSVSGSIGRGSSAPVNVSISLPGVTSPESFRASETQIAASLARVLARAERNQ
ncbi:MAG: phage tail tape measure C-terminal domain-containing protein [Pseudomonadota bacterium]